MIVPRFWAEAKAKKQVNGKQFTIKRFGWSDLSDSDAQKHAESRVQEAVEILLAEGDVRRIDRKASYNGAEGIPIREEVISSHDDVVVSRNAYGALCLNTPDVFFADVDFETRASATMRRLVFRVLFVLGALAALYVKSWAALLVAALAALIFASVVTQVIRDLYLRLYGGREKKALDTIKQVSRDNPELHFRIYRTPMGYRVLLMSGTLSPGGEMASKLMADLNSDSIYIQMCKNQMCFRARVSPKPWRIGMERLRPRPGVWPIKAERMPEREKWVSEYEDKAKLYAACHYLMSLGSSATDAKAESVRKLHDELSRANSSELKLA